MTIYQGTYLRNEFARLAELWPDLYSVWIHIEGKHPENFFSIPPAHWGYLKFECMPGATTPITLSQEIVTWGKGFRVFSRYLLHSDDLSPENAERYREAISDFESLAGIAGPKYIRRPEPTNFVAGQSISPSGLVIEHKSKPAGYARCWEEFLHVAFQSPKHVITIRDPGETEACSYSIQKLPFALFRASALAIDWAHSPGSPLMTPQRVAPAPAPTAAAETAIAVVDPITLEQAAVLVQRELQTLYNVNRKNRYPAPATPSRGSNPAVWRYSDLRPWLLTNWPDLTYRLPADYSAAKQIFS